MAFGCRNGGQARGTWQTIPTVAGRRRGRSRIKGSRGKLVRLQRRPQTTYRAYMRSKEWREFRAAWWATYDKKHPVRRCYICLCTQAEYGKTFDLHHVTYERLGREHFDDLVPLCAGPGRCHDRVTKAWRARHRTGLTMSLKELTDHHRRLARRKAVA